MIKAVLDAYVLYSAPLRGLLLNLAEDELFDPFWSEEIQDEWSRNLLKNRPNLKREKVERTCWKMEFHFPDSLIQGYEPIIPRLTLPDPKDRHVLAVAVHAKAEFIVTFNLKDFPKTVLQPFGIEAISPDEFVFRIIQELPHLILSTIKNLRLSLISPSKTAAEYIATLEKQKLPKTIAFLREHEAEI